MFLLIITNVFIYFIYILISVSNNTIKKKTYFILSLYIVWLPTEKEINASLPDKHGLDFILKGKNRIFRSILSSA